MTAALMGRPVREVPREGVLPGWREVAKADIALTGTPRTGRAYLGGKVGLCGPTKKPSPNCRSRQEHRTVHAERDRICVFVSRCVVYFEMDGHGAVDSHDPDPVGAFRVGSPEVDR